MFSEIYILNNIKIQLLHKFNFFIHHFLHLLRLTFNFSFVILEWCNSKFELGYKEIKLQLIHDVILNEHYYNGIVNCRLGRPPKFYKQ